MEMEITEVEMGAKGKKIIDNKKEKKTKMNWRMQSIVPLDVAS